MVRGRVVSVPQESRRLPERGRWAQWKREGEWREALRWLRQKEKGGRRWTERGRDRERRRSEYTYKGCLKELVSTHLVDHDEFRGGRV